jgi:hypothetical protein
MISTITPSIGTQLDRIRRAHPGGMVMQHVCDICGLRKGLKNDHQKCSKIRQQQYLKGKK